MITGKEDLLQSLIEIYSMEKASNEFYARASKKLGNSRGAKTFRELAGWEEEHMAYIQFLYQAVQGEKELIPPEEFKKDIPSPLLEGAISVDDARMTGKTEFNSDIDAINIALELEGRAYNLYRNSSEKAEDSNARIIFQSMMEQEKKHIGYLMALKKALLEEATP